MLLRLTTHSSHHTNALTDRLRSCAGDVAWAGGSAGPDFFIMMNKNGFGATHTVWGSMADQASMDLALKLVKGKSSSAPGTMRILDEPVRFTMTPVKEALPLIQVQ